MSRWLAALVLCAVLASAARAAAPDPVARGAELVRRAQCGRCHAVTGLGIEAAPRQESCSDCHGWVRGTRDDAQARAREARQYPLWNQYVDHVRSYLYVPDLAAAAARLDPAWVSRFLRQPYKVRPGFAETMIRTPFDAVEADAVAAFLRAAGRRAAAESANAAASAAATLPVSARAEDIAEGERLYGKLMCARCHALGARAAAPGIAAAPDLAHTRARMAASDVAAYLADPAAFGGAGGQQAMPSYGLTAREAARLRDFIVAGAPAAAAPAATTTAPVLASTASATATTTANPTALLSRRVSFREVNEQVFAAVCIHCHADGKLTGGDGGPGNTGGFGYRGAGVDFSSWRGILRGARRADGTRVSLLEAAPGQSEPPLLARLALRVREHAVERAGGRGGDGGAGAPSGPGMPLGQPPLDEARLRLVRSWIAQGAPGPGGRRGIR